MLVIAEKYVLSDELVTEKFVCDLNACKGACCIEGDYGAPLAEEELPILEEIYEAVKPYLTDKGIAAIEAQGKYTFDPEEQKELQYTTPLIDGGPCAYITYNDLGMAQCGIELAWKDGKVPFQKPISCHLYPIRVQKLPDYELLNYDRWSICSEACTNGARLKVPVYQFLKGPLIRKYGEEFYEELEAMAQHLKSNNP
jgi:hypothetical protein